MSKFKIKQKYGTGTVKSESSVEVVIGGEEYTLTQVVVQYDWMAVVRAVQKVYGSMLDLLKSATERINIEDVKTLGRTLKGMHSLGTEEQSEARKMVTGQLGTHLHRLGHLYPDKGEELKSWVLYYSFPIGTR